MAEKKEKLCYLHIWKYINNMYIIYIFLDDRSSTMRCVLLSLTRILCLYLKKSQEREKALHIPFVARKSVPFFVAITNVEIFAKILWISTPHPKREPQFVGTTNQIIRGTYIHKTKSSCKIGIILMEFNLFDCGKSRYFNEYLLSLGLIWFRKRFCCYIESCLYIFSLCF